MSQVFDSGMDEMVEHRLPLVSKESKHTILSVLQAR